MTGVNVNEFHRYGLGEISPKEIASIKQTIAEAESSTAAVTVPITKNIASKQWAYQDSVEISNASVGSSSGRQL